MQEETMVNVIFVVDGYGESRQLEIVTPDGAVFSYSHNRDGVQPPLSEFQELVNRQTTVTVNLKEERPNEFITCYSAFQYQFPLKDLGYDFYDYIRSYMRNVHFHVPRGGSRPESNFRLF